MWPPPTGKPIGTFLPTNPTAEPTGTPTDRTNGDTPTDAPTAKPVVVGGDPTSSTDKVRVLEPIDAFIVFDFFPGTGERPSDIEIDGLLEQTSRFIAVQLERIENQEDFLDAELELVSLAPH